MPSRWKHRKQFRGRKGWIAENGSTVVYWEFWLKIVDNWYISNRQLEAARKVIVRYTRKVWKLWIRIFTDLPYTKKALEVPMGSWKWDVDMYVARIKRWRVVFEVSWVTKEVAQEAFKQASYKLPFKTKLVEKNQVN